MAVQAGAIGKALGSWLLILSLPSALGWFAFNYSYRDNLPEALLTIDSADFIAFDQASASPSDPVISARLPDDWSKTHPHSIQGWYLSTIELNVPPNRLWGAYLPSVNMNAAVYLNGELLGQGGRFEDPIARVWNQPLYFTIPNGMLRPGDNLIQVLVKADPPSLGLLGVMYLGPDSELRPAYENHYFFKIDLVKLITATLIFMALSMGALWLLRRQDTLYGWFALASFFWGVHNLNLFVIHHPLPTRLWDWLFNYASLGGFTLFLIIFIHRYLNLLRVRIERLLIIATLTGSIILLLTPSPWFYWMAHRVWNPSLFLVGLYPTYLIFSTYWIRRDWSTRLMVISGLSIMVCAFHDLLIILGWLGRDEGYFIQYAAPAPLLVFGWLLLTDFVKARDEAETLNRTLERRVEEKAFELETNYQRLREMEHQQVLVEERERIMRDMHDGMGGHLVSTLSMVETGQAKHPEIATALRTALDDLRLLIDSLDPVEDDLTLVLGMYRSRLAPRLANSDIRIDWQVKDVPPIPDFGPRKVLQVLRILQEAVTNVLKHANAHTLTVRTGETQDPQKVFIEIEDDGQGMAGPRPGGKGLANMQWRAQSIGANIEMLTSTSGVKVRLWLPLQHPG